MQDGSQLSANAGAVPHSALNVNGLPRSPFMPIRKTNGSTGSLGTPRAGNAAPANPALLKGSMTPTAMSSRPALVPLTSSALASFNQQATVNNAAKSGSPLLCGDSDAGSTSTGVTNNAAINKYAGSKLGVASKPVPTSMLSSKRYTRQMAPASPEDDTHNPPRPGSSLAHTISASDLRAKARVTSGSAPRRKVGVVPGAERADPPARPTTPGLGFSRPETPSTGLQHRRARSNSKAAPPVPSVPSRPASRAGGEYAPSRSVSRMGDYPSSAFVSASQLSGDDLADRLNGVGLNAKSHRLDSDSSIATTLAVPKSESVLVCVRVRPPAVAHTVTSVNPAHLEEAWQANTKDKTIQLGDGSGNEYRFGKAAISPTWLAQLM